jgi:hypothetical protein
MADVKGIVIGILIVSFITAGMAMFISESATNYNVDVDTTDLEAMNKMGEINEISNEMADRVGGSEGEMGVGESSWDKVWGSTVGTVKLIWGSITLSQDMVTSSQKMLGLPPLVFSLIMGIIVITIIIAIIMVVLNRYKV